MERLQHLAINDEGFVFDPKTGESFTTNSSGLEILRLLKNGKTVEEVGADMAAMFGIAPDEAERDALDFMSQLKTCKLI